MILCTWPPFIYMYHTEYYLLGHPFSQYSSAKRRCSWRFSRGPMSMSVRWLCWGVYLGQTSKPLHSDYYMFKDCCLFSIFWQYMVIHNFFFFFFQ